MTLKRTFITAIGLIIIFSFSGCFCRWVPSNDMTGKWSGNQEVTVRTKDENGKFVFTKTADSVLMMIEIQANGVVEGKFGDAVFTSCDIEKNRGKVGKTLNINTDYIIVGTLEGHILANDPIDIKNITFPINLKNNQLKGTIFQKEGITIYPMSTILLLKKK